MKFFCGIKKKFSSSKYNRTFQINSLNLNFMFLIHNGRSYLKLVPSHLRLFYKLGQFSATRKPFFYFSKKKKK